jgi:hypothetical protein
LTVKKQTVEIKSGQQSDFDNWAGYALRTVAGIAMPAPGFTNSGYNLEREKVTPDVLPWR